MRVVLAAGTVGGAGTTVALAAARKSLAADPRVTEVVVVEPGSSRVRALWNEARGVPAGDVYIGFADRLPLWRQPSPVGVFVAQNPHLYRTATGFGWRSRAKFALLGWWARRSLRRADFVVCSTQAGADIVDSWVGSGTEVAVRPIPVPVAASDLEIAPVIGRILLVGDHYSYKHWPVAIDAAGEFAAGVGRPIDVVHLGDEREPAAFEAAQRAAERVAAADVPVTVQFLGPRSRDEVFEQMSRADVLMMPSASETQGLPVAEAMAAGVPVVCRDLPVFVDQGADALTTVPVEAGSSEFAHALVLLDDPEVRERRASTGASLVVRGDEWDLLPPGLAHGVKQP